MKHTFYKLLLFGFVLGLTPLHGQGAIAPDVYTFATMSDGVDIALAIGYPRGFDQASDRTWPALFMFCGYASSVAPLDPEAFGHEFITVNASIRGSGASGGALDPWSERSWRDGYEVIENWIVKQPWSNGRVGIIGHSWPGIMGYLVAATAPPSVEAVCVSGLIEDAYRGICRPGGVMNCGFPVDWLNGFYGLEGPFDSGPAARKARGLDQEAFQAIIDARPQPDYRNDMLWRLLHHPLYDEEWVRQSLVKHAANIKAPVLMAQAYQDEQTGPSGLWIWKAIPEEVPKRLVLSNGNHGITIGARGEMMKWLRHWLLDEKNDSVVNPDRRVQAYFETRQDGRRGAVAFGKPLQAADFPLPDTRWTRLYLQDQNRLAFSEPDNASSADSYRVGRNAISASDETLEYSMAIDEPMAVCGPITLTFWASLSTIDTDFFVLLADEAPDGARYGLQRGLLRASHRELDSEASLYVEAEGGDHLVRPVHKHRAIEPVTPHRITRYEIEIPVLGHVFRPGHKLVLRISRPPLGDPIGVTRSGEPSYQYDSDAPPGMVKIWHGAEHPSHLLMPIIDGFPGPGNPAVPLDQQAGLQRLR